MTEVEDGHRASPKPARDGGSSSLADLAPPEHSERNGTPGAAEIDPKINGQPCQTKNARDTAYDKSLAEGVTAPLLRKAFAQHLRNSPYLTPGLARTLAHDVETMPLAGAGSPQLANEETGEGHSGTGRGEAKATTAISLTALAEAAYNLSLYLRELLIARHNLPAELADRIALHGREGTLIRGVQPNHERGELLAFVSYLAQNGGLTASLLLRSLCLGHMTLFEIAVARLSGTKVEEAGRRIHGKDIPAFSDLYKSAGLPDDLYRAFRVAVKVHHRLTDGQAGPWNHGNTIEVIENLVKEYEHLSPEDLEHVLSQLAREPLKTASLSSSLNFASA